MEEIFPVLSATSSVPQGRGNVQKNLPCEQRSNPAELGALLQVALGWAQRGGVDEKREDTSVGTSLFCNQYQSRMLLLDEIKLCIVAYAHFTTLLSIHFTTLLSILLLHPSHPQFCGKCSQFFVLVHLIFLFEGTLVGSSLEIWYHFSTWIIYMFIVYCFYMGNSVPRSLPPIELMQ